MKKVSFSVGLVLFLISCMKSTDTKPVDSNFQKAWFENASIESGDTSFIDNGAIFLLKGSSLPTEADINRRGEYEYYDGYFNSIWDETGFFEWNNESILLFKYIDQSDRKDTIDVLEAFINGDTLKLKSSKDRRIELILLEATAM